MSGLYEGSIKFDTKIDSREFDRGISKLKNVGIKGFAAIGAAATAGFGVAAKAGMDFEEAMSSVVAISMATGKDLENLTSAARKMGETTKYTATQAANALEYLSLAGYTAEESVRALPQVLNLAAAGGMDLAYASDLLTDSMAVMGLGIDNMQNFSDQLAMAASKSNTSVQQLGEAVLIAGGQAKLAKMSVVEMNTALGILADKGIKGSEGGTALRNTLKNIYTPTSQAADMLERLGVKTSNASGELLPMQDILVNLRKSLNSLSEADKMTAMSQIFDTRTIAAASALLDDCGSRWDELSGYLSDCDGAASQMAETMNDNLKGQLTLAASAAESLGIEIYTAVGEKLKDSVSIGAAEISKLTTSLQSGELAPAISNVGSLFSKLADGTIKLATGALPPLIKVLGFCGKNFGSLAAAGTTALVVIKGYSIIGTITSLLAANNAVLAKHCITTAAATTAETLHTAGLTAHQIILGALSGKIKLATAAQAALNAVTSANPYVLLGLALTAVVGGLAALILFTDDETESEKEHRKAVEANTKAINEAAESYKSYTQQQAETANAAIAEVDSVNRLSQELFRLADAGGHVDEANRGRAQFILNQLNKALGTEYTMTGNLINGYNMLKNSIHETIEAKKLEILMNEASENYAESIRNQADALNKLTEARKNYAQNPNDNSEAALKKAEEYYIQLLNYQFDYEEASKIAQEQGTSATISFLEQRKEAYANAAIGVENYVTAESQAMAEAGQAYQKSLYNLQIALTQYNKTGSDGAKAMVLSCIDELNASKDKWAAAGGDLSSVFVKSLDGSTVNISQVSKNIADQLAKAVENGLKIPDIELQFNTGDKWIPEIAQIFTNAGTKAGQGFRNGISSAISEESDVAVTAAGTMSENIVNICGTTLNPQEINALGLRIPQGIASGINAGMGPLRTAAQNMSNECLKIPRNFLIIRSPSRLMRDQVGKYIPLGIAAGITENTDAVKDSFQKMLDVLEYQRKFDIINEDAYYTELEKLRDKYFTAGSKEWLDYTEKIYTYQQNAVKKAYSDIQKYADDKLGEVIDKQEAYAKKLNSFGSLFKEVSVVSDDGEDKFYALADLDKQNAELVDYNNKLTALKQMLADMGISKTAADSFFADISGRSIEDGIKALDALQYADRAKLTEYLKSYDTRIQLTTSLSAEQYDSDMRTAIDESYSYMKSELEKAGFEVPSTFFDVGSASAKSFGDAFAAEIDEQMQGVQDKINEWNIRIKASIEGGSRVGNSTTTNTTNSNNTTTYNITTQNGEDTVDRLKREEKIKRMSGI